MEDIIIVGFGGHAKSVVDCIERSGKYNIVGYTDIEEHVSKYRYLGNDDVLEVIYKDGIKNAVVGIGYLGKDDIRQKLYNRLKGIGYELPVIFDPSTVVSDSAEIDEGTFIGKNAIVNAEAKIGKMAIINTKALVEHECVVGDFAHIAVGTVLCGQVVVGNGAFVGANATVIQCREIGDRVIVPAGEVVRKNMIVKKITKKGGVPRLVSSRSTFESNRRCA